jgi:hypothetical protein
MMEVSGRYRLKPRQIPFWDIFSVPFFGLFCIYRPLCGGARSLLGRALRVVSRVKTERLKLRHGDYSTFGTRRVP